MLAYFYVSMQNVSNMHTYFWQQYLKTPQQEFTIITNTATEMTIESLTPYTLSYWLVTNVESSLNIVF